MTTLADRVIAALRGTHDHLAAVVPTLSDDQLAAPSGAGEWTVAQVLSHLGSGAEIGRAGYDAALAGTEPPGREFNQPVWDRWNALSPRAQAAGFLEHDARLVGQWESLAPDVRQSLQVPLGFLPFPLPLAGVAGMRLSETAQHAWDVDVAFDPAAVLDPGAAAVLVELYAGPLGFLLGFIAKPEQLPAPAVVRVPGAGVDLVVGDGAAVVASDGAADAELSGPPEALLRLIAGRLGPAHTPAGVAVSGSVTLDDLRRVFPGY